MEKVFQINGWFKKNNQKMDFTKEVVASSEELAIERIYSILGSKHAVKRSLINLSKVEEISPEEAENPDIRSELKEE